MKTSNFYTSITESTKGCQPWINLIRMIMMIHLCISTVMKTNGKTTSVQLLDIHAADEFSVIHTTEVLVKEPRINTDKIPQID